MLSLDHAEAIVHDLAAGALRWERLGFTLSPVSRQRGKMPGREADGPWATANRCAIFGRGYLELIGIVDPAGYNPWAGFIERFEGLHLLALRAPEADAAWAELSSRTDTLSAPVQRARNLDVDGIERTMRFRNIFSKDAHYPEGRYIVLEHQTPEYLWQPKLMQHPNGALALEACMVCATDLPAQSARLQTLLGRAPAKRADGVLVFAPGDGGSIELWGTAHFASEFGWQPPALPCFAGVRIGFADRAMAAQLMEDNGIRIRRGSGAWFAGPADSGGFVLELTG